VEDGRMSVECSDAKIEGLGGSHSSIELVLDRVSLPRKGRGSR